MEQRYVKAEYPQSQLTGRIIAAATEVHRTLGPGFEEVIYQRKSWSSVAKSGSTWSTKANQSVASALIS